MSCFLKRAAAIIEQFAAYKSLGFSDLVVDFRRNGLSQMVETPDLMGTKIRPAVQTA
jgi:hypothetical protein